jgi:putative ABC transport system permease protein
MAQAVRERVAELGVLKALGFSNGLVLTLVLAESCVLAATGGFVGLGVIWLLITIGGSPMPSMLPVFFLPERYLLIGGGFVLALGVVVGILPALQAGRLQVAVALRREA